jgi:hypothetical protein
MCTVCESRWMSSLRYVPPVDVITCTFKYLPSSLHTCAVCNASSRVGTRISAANSPPDYAHILTPPSAAMKLPSADDMGACSQMPWKSILGMLAEQTFRSATFRMVSVQQPPFAWALQHGHVSKGTNGERPRIGCIPYPRLYPPVRRNVRARPTQGRVAPAKGNAKLMERPLVESGPREARPARLHRPGAKLEGSAVEALHLRLYVLRRPYIVTKRDGGKAAGAPTRGKRMQNHTKPTRRI